MNDGEDAMVDVDGVNERENTFERLPTTHYNLVIEVLLTVHRNSPSRVVVWSDDVRVVLEP